MTISKGDVQIQTLDVWKACAGPKKSEHWQDHRSAKEGARAWLGVTSPELPPGLAELLMSHADFDRVTGWTAEPEAKIRFDSFAGEPRNTDLLVLANDSFGVFVISVEAKGHETFGPTIIQAISTAKKYKNENPRSNGLARIEQLCVAICGTSPQTDPHVGKLRYQLLTAAAGALHAATVSGCKRAVLLVHEFKTKLTSDRRHSENAADLKAFVRRLSNESEVDLERLNGPLLVPGTPLFKTPPDLYIGKIVCDIRSRAN